MRWESPPKEDVPDRRVRRSRTALLAAAVRLVSERETAAIPAGELADAADVSRKLLYLHFGDRDGLFVAAAVDLVERDLLVQVRAAGEDLRARLLATTRHFAGHRSFYRAVLTGSCAFAVTARLNGLFGSLSAAAVQERFGELDERTVADLTVLFAVGAGALTYDWLIHAADPLDPGVMADRLQRIAVVLGPSVPPEGGSR